MYKGAEGGKRSLSNYYHRRKSELYKKTVNDKLIVLVSFVTTIDYRDDFINSIVYQQTLETTRYWPKQSEGIYCNLFYESKLLFMSKI